MQNNKILLYFSIYIKPLKITFENKQRQEETIDQSSTI